MTVTPSSIRGVRIVPSSCSRMSPQRKSYFVRLKLDFFGTRRSKQLHGFGKDS